MKVNLDNGSHQVIEISLKGIEVFSIVASVFSIVLGIVAIWLSVVFYKMSESSSKDMERSSNAISSNVQKLDVLFEKMYTDTFGMVKETVSDMRKYVYKGNGKEDGNEISEEIETKTNEIVNKALEGIHANSLSKEQVKDLVFNLIDKSKDVEHSLMVDSYIEKVKDILIRHKRITFPELVKEIYGEKPTSKQSAETFNALDKMTNEGIIKNPFNEDPDDGSKGIFHSTAIELNPKYKSKK